MCVLCLTNVYERVRGRERVGGEGEREREREGEGGGERERYAILIQIFWDQLSFKKCKKTPKPDY